MCTHYPNVIASNHYHTHWLEARSKIFFSNWIPLHFALYLSLIITINLCYLLLIFLYLIATMPFLFRQRRLQREFMTLQSLQMQFKLIYDHINNRRQTLSLNELRRMRCYTTFYFWLLMWGREMCHICRVL